MNLQLTTSFAIISICMSVLCLSCSGTNLRRTGKSVRAVLDKESFQNHHYGLLVLDAGNGDTLIKHNSARYFVPASNVKIATFFAAVEYLPKQLPLISYSENGDSIFIRGLGNPASLHPKFQDSTLIEFLDSYPHVFYSDSNFKDDKWAPGWAWEDFDRSYAVERSSLPLYGNVISITDGPEVTPIFFRDSVIQEGAEYRRSFDKNEFYVSADRNDTLVIPFKTGPELTIDLLSDALKRPVQYSVSFPEDEELKILSGFPRDSVLKEMMIESDNFLAEQLLVMVSSSLSDTLDISKSIEKLKAEIFPGGDQTPRWVDGSGLSRYNLFTPASIVSVLKQLNQRYNWAYLKGFFPAGGQSGTLREEFQSASEPYLLAKSGSMGNIYCLSGFLETEGGKLLIFSFMNNNFSADQSPVIKGEMGQIFELLRKMD